MITADAKFPFEKKSRNDFLNHSQSNIFHFPFTRKNCAWFYFARQIIIAFD
jgi:hypothetical protein